MRPPSHRLPFPAVVVAALLLTVVAAVVLPGHGIVAGAFLLLAVLLYTGLNARSRNR